MFSQKELAECVHKKQQKLRENGDRYVRERIATQVQVDRETAMLQAIYRILINLPDNLLQNQA